MSIKVLITRPEAQSKQLAFLLEQQGIAHMSQPLFDYQNNTTLTEVKNGLEQTDIIIFVSTAAVTFAQRAYPLFPTVSKLKIKVVAVGQATKKALLALGFTDVLVPEQENSEGVLRLELLQKIKHQHITIVRGNGGREHLATNLTQRGAQICYIESYRRIWRPLAKNSSERWQAQQINCILVTSNDILMALIKLLRGEQDQLPDYWRHDCVWVVVSSRIENNAKSSGIIKVVNSHGANATLLTATLNTLTVS